MNLTTNTRTDGTPSTICLTCATSNRLMHMPCAKHFPAMPSELCNHTRTKTVFIHDGTALACFDCDLFIPTN
jgi:hypothetical protein